MSQLRSTALLCAQGERRLLGRLDDKWMQLSPQHGWCTEMAGKDMSGRRGLEFLPKTKAYWGSGSASLIFRIGHVTVDGKAPWDMRTVQAWPWIILERM